VAKCWLLGRSLLLAFDMPSFFVNDDLFGSALLIKLEFSTSKIDHEKGNRYLVSEINKQFILNENFNPRSIKDIFKF
jgi:hypothetical protein